MNSPLTRWLTHPYLLLTLTVLFWSGNMVVGRGVRHDIPPLTLAFGRWFLAFLLVLPLALPHWRTGWPALKAAWRPVLGLGLLGVGGYNTFAYIALQNTSATNGALLNSFVPIVTITLSWAFLGKRLTPLAGLGVLISLSGAITIISRGDLEVLRHLNLNVGDVWMMTAVLTWALYTVGLIWRPQGVHPMAMLAAFILVGLCALFPASLWELIIQGRHVQVQPSTVATFAYVALFPSFLGYIFYNRAVAEVGANKASLFIHLMPVFGTLLSALFLGEVPAGYHYLGITLIFTGIGLTMRKG